MHAGHNSVRVDMAQHQGKEKVKGRGSPHVEQPNTHVHKETKCEGGTKVQHGKRACIIRGIIQLAIACLLTFFLAHYVAQVSSDIYTKTYIEQGADHIEKMRKVVEEAVGKIKSYDEEHFKKIDDAITRIDSSMRQLEQTVVKNVDTMESDAIADKAVRFRIINIAFNIKHRIRNGLDIQKSWSRYIPYLQMWLGKRWMR